MDAFEYSTAPPPSSEALAPIYEELRAGRDTIDLVLTGHAHIDLVWLWPERVGDFKAVHSFANALSVHDPVPGDDLRLFAAGQLSKRWSAGTPQLIDRVKGAVKEGWWEPTGALYVESDTQLPCGEALVRAFELGQAGFNDLRGEGSNVVWIPDVFGYSGVLPTLMAGFGVPYFYTTKMHWSGATRFPHSSYKWRGNDGSEVLAHLTWTHYNGTITPAELVDYRPPAPPGGGPPRSAGCRQRLRRRRGRGQRGDVRAGPAAGGPRPACRARSGGPPKASSTGWPSGAMTCPRGRARCTSSTTAGCTPATAT